ncbi:hypothetical protein ACIGB6_14570 [Paeniglutamicibacter gangotriensis]|uniref:hypothetical protein n=1 Tax=Paeniglutamicibacter gangotriensis TaxID=254787 RepID=UPI0037C5F11F
MKGSIIQNGENDIVNDNIALEMVAQQIWSAGLADGSLHMGINRKTGPNYRVAESYWIIPNAVKPRYLVPVASRVVTANALTKFRGLRSARVNTARLLLGFAAKLCIPLSRDKLSIYARTDSPATSPLQHLKQQLGVTELYAATGVRLGLNAKPTLHLFDSRGKPVGFAKLSWNTASTKLISNEANTLRDLDGGSSLARVPRLLFDGDVNGKPYIVTSPLPESVRGLSGSVHPPTPLEMHSLAPLNGLVCLADLAFYTKLRQKISALAGKDPASTLGNAARTLISLLDRQEKKVPTTERWHGDLVPWNCARDSNGTLWCWDWETSDPDVVAGLDILHWTFNVRKKHSKRDAGQDLRCAIQDSQLYLRAASMDDEAVSIATGVYVLILVERAWTLALDDAGWSRSWISEQDLEYMLMVAQIALTTREP